ncbi:AIPR family protein [Nocardia asiatica]|uniref:AIPR family protein n=1 Tax=Nocardia asiatica TaxID=209252 RepID=UPI0002DC16C7|nr:AIPR family protein [Nocardia asiatica]
MTAGGYETKLQISQLSLAVQRDYVPHVHRNGSENTKQLLSRGLAAMAVRILTGSDVREAAECGTDGSQDDGIDAIAVHPDGSTIYLVQAKWHDNGNKVIDVSEAHKMLDGLDCLREGRFHRENKRAAAMLPQLRPLLNKPGVSVVLVVAATSDRNIDDNVEEVFARRLAGPGFITKKQIRLRDFHRQIVLESQTRSPSVEASLYGWRQVMGPYRAIYGRISAGALAEWYERYGTKLFDENLRTSLGVTDINESIYRTLLDEPKKFWYLHNGLTILCEDWPQAPGISGDETFFRFTNVSIVNGAQTVTQIHRARKDNPEAVAIAQVAVRFIALADCPEGFGSTVTFAANSQNRIYSRDYLALEPNQIRLRDDFRLTYDMEYILRSTDHLSPGRRECSVVEAVAAMACAESAELACVAKTEISRIWESTKAALYRGLFNSRTSVVEVWRRIQVLRLVENTLGEVDASCDERMKTVAVHGNRLITHAVFQMLDSSTIAHVDADWSPQLGRVGFLTNCVLKALTDQINMYMPADLSKNNQQKVAKKLHQPESAENIVRLALKRVDHIELESASDPAQQGPSSAEPVFVLQARGALAHGRRCDGGFLVLKGSTASAGDTPSLAPRYRDTRQNFLDSLVFVPHDGKLLLNRDELFDSASDAANVMKGVQTNGPIGWHTVDGKSYKELSRVDIVESRSQP